MSSLIWLNRVGGGAKDTFLQPLVRILNKVFGKFGRRFMHTVNRLKKFSLLKLKDELSIQESKFLWKWDKKKFRKVFRI